MKILSKYLLLVGGLLCCCCSCCCATDKDANKKVEIVDSSSLYLLEDSMIQEKNNEERTLGEAKLSKMLADSLNPKVVVLNKIFNSPIADSLVEIKKLTFDGNIHNVFYSGAKEYFTSMEQNLEERNGNNYITYIQKLLLPSGYIHDFEPFESIFLVNDLNVYTRKNDVDKHQSVINKYKIIQGNSIVFESSSELFSLETSMIVSNDINSPSFLISDNGDGGGYEYKLISSDLERIKSYVPYIYGYRSGVYTKQNDNFILITEDFKNNGVYKFCLMNNEGIILLEKEVNLKEDVIFSVTPIQDKYLLSTYDKSPFENHAILLDGNFSVLWEKKCVEPFIEVKYFPLKNRCYFRGNTTCLYTINMENGEGGQLQISDLYSFEKEARNDLNEYLVIKDIVKMDEALFALVITKQKNNNGIYSYSDTEVIVLNLENENSKFVLNKESVSSISVKSLINKTYFICGQNVFIYEKE